MKILEVGLDRGLVRRDTERSVGETLRIANCLDRVENVVLMTGVGPFKPLEQIRKSSLRPELSTCRRQRPRLARHFSPNYIGLPSGDPIVRSETHTTCPALDVLSGRPIWPALRCSRSSAHADESSGDVVAYPDRLPPGEGHSNRDFHPES